VVPEHGSPLELDGLCVVHAFISVACVSYACIPCACFLCVVLIMVLVMSSCEV